MASPWGHSGARSGGARGARVKGEPPRRVLQPVPSPAPLAQCQPHQQQLNVPKAWLSPTRVWPSQGRVEHPCVPPSRDIPLALNRRVMPPQPSPRHAQSLLCKHGEQPQALSMEVEGIRAGGEGREGVRWGAWSFSSPPFSSHLVRISHAPF